MNLFSLDYNIFEVGTVAGDEDLFFPVGGIVYDRSQVKSVSMVAYNGSDDDFAIYQEAYNDEWVLYTSIQSLSLPSKKYKVGAYIEYVDVNDMPHSVLETFDVYGFADSTAMPSIKYIENLASRVNENAEITLHGDNFNTELSIFLYAFTDNSGTPTCYQIPPEDVVWDIDAGTAKFVVYKGMLAQDDTGEDACGTYSIFLGYGDCNLPKTFLNSETANLGIIRYKYDQSNIPSTSTSPVSTENQCIRASNLTLNKPVSTDGVAVDSTSATDSYGSTMYVKPGMDENCSCDQIKYYRVKLKYNKRLERRYGEMVLDGVYLKTNDIVWLAAQFDGSEGLWKVSPGEWIGVESLENAQAGIGDDEFNPCVNQQIPKKVDCSVFVDLGARVTTDVDYACSDDVPNKFGSQTVCSYNVKPGDVIALDNQSDGLNGLWEVTCGPWKYLGAYDFRNGTTVDVSDSIIVQNDIDFCKCGGIFHIDYYYLNSACYLNHIRRTVKVLCSGASIAPNNEHQFILTDYQIRTGVDDSLVANNGRTAGDPVEEDCVAEVFNYDLSYRSETIEYSNNCGESGDVIDAPNCAKICDCERYFQVEFSNDYVTSRDKSGFTILFWKREYDGWHLYAYIGAGTMETGMRYYVYHLHTAAAMATERLVDVNEEIVYLDGDEYKSTQDAWFVEHDGVLCSDFGLVDDSWDFIEYDREGNATGTYTHILSANNLYQKWSIKCTTLLLAHRLYDEPETAYNMRRTCADMTDEAKRSVCEPLIIGTTGVYGFKYYRTVMSMKDFINMYNSYMGETNCISPEGTPVLSTDGRVPISTDDERIIVI